MEPFLNNERPEDWKIVLENIENEEERRKYFCDKIKDAIQFRIANVQDLIKQLTMCESLFPSVDSLYNTRYFMKFALEHGLLAMLKALDENGMAQFDSFSWEDGKSAVHYLVERAAYNYFQFRDLILYILERFTANHRDALGFTFLHGACAIGRVELVRKFMGANTGQLVATAAAADRLAHSWACSPPLHVAARFRHSDCVKLLLREGRADPNREDDHEAGATPLHALALACLPGGGFYFNGERRSAARIIDALLEAGANIEARDRRGLSPLGMAVARYDTDLVRALLDRGADVASLDEDGWFRGAAQDDFSAHELKCYPLTLDIVETMKLLKSAGREMNHETRHRMLKYWKKIEENDTDYLIPDDSALEASSYIRLVQNLVIFNEYGFYIRPESMNHLRQFYEATRKKMPENFAEWVEIRDAPHNEFFMNMMKMEVDTLKGIKLNDDISLYRLCQMNYRRGYSILEKMNDWHVPSGCENELYFLRQIFKRHLGNILIRRHLKLFAAELFANDPRCRLNLPYDVCYLIAESMSNEDLFYLCEHS
ncbi:hypothetical protein TKK_0015076 [Trichogramma kaykai]